MFDNEITFVFGPPTTADAEEVVKKWTHTKEAEEWWQTKDAEEVVKKWPQPSEAPLADVYHGYIKSFFNNLAKKTELNWTGFSFVFSGVTGTALHVTDNNHYVGWQGHIEKGEVISNPTLTIQMENIVGAYEKPLKSFWDRETITKNFALITRHLVWILEADWIKTEISFCEDGGERVVLGPVHYDDAEWELAGGVFRRYCLLKNSDLNDPLVVEAIKTFEDITSTYLFKLNNFREEFYENVYGEF